MVTSNLSSLTIDNICNDLFNYSIDRNDIKFVLNNLSKFEKANFNLLEYELQILKIISVGWAISFFMFNKSEKNFILETFWNKIQKFSLNLSSKVLLTSGIDVAYFDILKRRINSYVAYFKTATNGVGVEPIDIIGPIFAKTCNLENNIYAILAGTKLFSISINEVKHYLDSI